MKFGGWNIKVVTGGMPQKLATAYSEIFDNMVGAEYSPIAYLGTQVVNGINHAILAEQTLITGRDTKNIVLIVINEKDGQFAVARIEHLVESGLPMGGIQIDVHTEIPADAQEAYDKAFEGFVGSNNEPFALLATQVTKGVNYIFAATSTPVVCPTVTMLEDGQQIIMHPEMSVDIITVNPMLDTVDFEEVISGSSVVMA